MMGRPRLFDDDCPHPAWNYITDPADHDDVEPLAVCVDCGLIEPWGRHLDRQLATADANWARAGTAMRMIGRVLLAPVRRVAERWSDG